MFYYAILTDVEGTHSYCGCLLFYEPVVSKKLRPASVRRTTSGTDQQASVTESADEEQSEMIYYVPKCLCLVTRQEHLATIKVIRPCYLVCIVTYLCLIKFNPANSTVFISQTIEAYCTLFTFFHIQNG